MGASGQCFVEWKEQFVSKERGKRVVHYFLKDIKGESILAVVGTERSVRHMFYVVAEEFLKVNEADNSVNAGYRWRSRREVVNWLTSMLSKQHRQGVNTVYPSHFARNPKLHTREIVWSGAAWTCSKQLKHFPAFCRNGITISVQSFVFVMAEDENRHIAYLEDMYEDRKGQKKVKVRWFHHNQEVQCAVTLRNPHPKEVFITPHAQVISVECVDGPAIVLTREHYEKCVSILPEDLLTRVHLCYRQFKSNRVKPFKLSKLCGYSDQPVFSCLDTDHLEDEEHSPGENDVRLGAKRPRSSRRREAMAYEPSSMSLKYEMLRKKLIPKYVNNQPSYNPLFKTDDKIELLCQDSGIRGCWFRCTVLEVTRRKVKVQYDDLKDEEGNGNLEEWVLAFRLAMPDKLGVRHSGRPTMRPAVTQSETNVAFEVGSPVDAWWSDGWWEGVVTETSDSEDGDVQVYVPSENRTLKLQGKKIRVSRDWVGDRWVDLKPNPNILTLIPGSTGPDTTEVKQESLTIPSKQTPVGPAVIVDTRTNLSALAPVDLPEPVDSVHEEKKTPLVDETNDGNANHGAEKTPSSDENDKGETVAMECETSIQNSEAEANPMEVS